MLNIDEINKEILMLESNRDTTYAVVEKLAMLYVVRDHITGAVSQSVPLEVEGESEFLKSVDGKDCVQVWAVMDELMESLKIINRRVYDAVMQKISKI